MDAVAEHEAVKMPVTPVPLARSAVDKEPSPEQEREANADFFGGCPVCHGSDVVLHVGRDHWFVCHRHRTKWLVGSNLFDSWRHQSDDQRDENIKVLREYTDVEPWIPQTEKLSSEQRAFDQLMDCLRKMNLKITVKSTEDNDHGHIPAPNAVDCDLRQAWHGFCAISGLSASSRMSIPEGIAIETPHPF